MSNVLPKNFHLAIIMDGNGRWARSRGLPRLFGHEAGLGRLEEVFKSAADLGVGYLTIFAFSTENWKRAPSEVSGLMGLFRRYLEKQAQKLVEKNIRVRFIGDREIFEPSLKEGMNNLEVKTQQNTGMNLVVAMNYGGRSDVVRAARKILAKNPDPQEIDEDYFDAHLDTAGMPPVDLLVRTSGEQRISNFLLWQIAYAELAFVDVFWPDFGAQDLECALDDYHARERRFGKEEKNAAS